MQKGKYAHITPHLKRLGAELDGDPKYQERVQQVKLAAMAPHENAPQNAEAVSVRLMVVDGAMDDADEELKAAFEVLMHVCSGRQHGVELARAYVTLRVMKDKVKGWLSTVNLMLEAYAQLMTDQLENEGVSSLGIDGRPLSFFDEPYSKVVSKDDVRQFFMNDKLLQPSLQPMWQTLDSLNRKRLLAGEDVVPGTEVYARRKIRLGGADD